MKTVCFNFLLDLIAMRLRFCLVCDLNILIQVVVSASCGIDTDRMRYVTATHFFLSSKQYTKVK